MKKVSLFVAVLMVSMMLLGALALAETKLGQSIYAAHGTSAVCIATVAMDGDVITAVLIEELQYMNPEVTTSFPNAETFTNAAGNVLASKRVNDEYYSGNMAEKAGSTQKLSVSFAAIEEFCVGKTIAELEAAVEGKDPTDADNKDMSDVITSSTLVDTLGYVLAVIEAAKAV